MKVIVAGFSKTGTKSMQAALTKLGYNVYDYMENYAYLGDEWNKIFLKGGNTEDFRQMFENVDAVTDLPACYFWEEIHKAFPDSKIVLMIRENEDEWIESVRNQENMAAGFAFRIMTYLSPTFWKLKNFGDRATMATCGIKITNHPFKPEVEINELLMRMTYRRHNSYVKQIAPKDKLLIFNVKEGWEPLCKFLQVEVPSEPFPHKNVRGNILDELMMSNPTLVRGQREVMGSLALLALLISYGVYTATQSPSYDWLQSCKNLYNSLLAKLRFGS